MGLVERGSHYTDEQRRQAVVELYIQGNLTRVSERLGIPKSTICCWKKEDWWQEISVQVQTEIDDEILASNIAIARESQEALLERIRNGETKVSKDGERVSQPVSARDLSIIGGIAQDKARVQRNMPTSISSKSAQEEALKGLADFLRQVAREERVVSDQ